MSVAARVREEISRAEVGTWFVVRDVVADIGRRHAVELALTKAAAADGTLCQFVEGSIGRGVKTRFGSTRPESLDSALARSSPQRLR